MNKKLNGVPGGVPRGPTWTLGVSNALKVVSYLYISPSGFLVHIPIVQQSTAIQGLLDVGTLRCADLSSHRLYLGP